MSRLLIVLAAAILFWAQLTAPVEAQGSWTCTYDFSTGTHGWGTAQYAAGSPYNASGTLTGGVWTTGDFTNSPYTLRALNIGLSFASTTITNVSMSYAFTKGTYVPSAPGSYGIITVKAGSTTVISSLNQDTPPASPSTWSGSVAGVTTFGVMLAPSIRNDGSNGGGSASISSITLQGTGTAPCAATPTPTPMPATPTPVDPVIFAQSNWSCPFDFRSHGLQGWQVITGSYVPGAGVQGAYPTTNQIIEVTLPLNAGTTLYDIRIEYDSTTGTETVLRADGATFDDANGLSAGNQIVWWQGNQAFNSSLNIRIIGSLFTPATMHLNSTVLRGYGAAPPCSNSGLPQPSPTPQLLDAGNLWTGLADANNTLNGLNPNSVGGGVPAETGRALFGYVKWIVSPSSADELAGPFAPLISHTGVFIALMFVLVLVYAVVWAVIWILRFIYWLYRLIVQIVDLVLQVAQVIGAAIGSAGQLVGSFIGSAIKFLF